ncbi:MAG: hypothetical protein R2762_05355 [Bryobacteraceae bacterium]
MFLLAASLAADDREDDRANNRGEGRSRGGGSGGGSGSSGGSGGQWRVVGWNDLGMHCMDGKDYSIYSILPPFNTFHAQVVDGSGRLVKDGSMAQVTFESIADPDGSINRSTIGKTNFWDFVSPLFGVNVAPDVGLAGYRMPGAANTPQPMAYDPQFWQYSAEGVPISPYDDAGRKNYYPMMRITARSPNGTVLAASDVVLPVSDEIDCAVCHSSGSQTMARPNAGWAFLSDPEKDYKTNVLRLHDERQSSSPLFQTALAAAGYNAAGLMATVNGGKPILCAKCHLSNALPGTGVPGVAPLTAAIHSYHGHVIDPTNQMPLDSVDNRSACYRCHPGSVTRCLRGAMGSATLPDGSMQMQCQSCHGNMTLVGSASRKGWLDQPNCQACHTGTAVRNNGQIRYASVFENSGLMRVAADATFATNADTPAAGLSLFRFSRGHGGLQCEACHGSTHAEYPSSHTNDNLQMIALQGHAGVLSECSTCHAGELKTVTGGPHGLHPIGPVWIDKHKDAAEKNAAQCRTCHGADYRGTVLSATLADRTLKSTRGSKTFAKGTRIGCYDCHNGPRGE